MSARGAKPDATLPVAPATTPSPEVRRRPWDALLDALLPPRCIAWDVALEPGCDTFCQAAAETLMEDTPSPNDVAALFGFGGALRDAMVRAKYDPDESRGRALARFFERELGSRLTDPSHDVAHGGLWPLAPALPSLVTFVPAHWRRRLWRGFDLPGLLADAAGRAFHLPVVDLLTCTRHEAPLSAASTSVERATRASDRYRLRPGKAPIELGPPRTILLIDDVVTTGASLRAAAEPLAAYGYDVRCLALARTPPPEAPRHLDAGRTPPQSS